MAGRRVLVVGGGIAGLAAAAALRRQAIDVDVLELGHSWVVAGSGIQQQANVVRALAGIGFRGEFIAAGFGFSRMRSFDMQGRLAAETVLPRLAGFDCPAMIGIARPALHRLLLAAASRAGARVQLGCSVAQLQPEGEGVRATLTDGSRRDYDLVVGADGMHSRVRHQVFGERFAPRQLDQVVWSCMLPRPPELDCLEVQAGPHGHCGACPVSADQAYVFLTAARGDGGGPVRGQLAGQMRALLSAYRGPVASLGAKVDEGSQLVCRPLETLLLPGDWHRGAVLLVGDAAHGCAPHLGQGAGMAIEDAVVLAEELARDQPVAAALRRFMERRRERVAFVWQASERLAAAEIAGDPGFDRRALYQQMIDVTSQPP